MTNVICAIAKCEEDYIKDWVEWHLNLGFDHIYVYDNSDTEEKALKNYYINEKLTYIPVYGVHENMFQIKCYNEFYNSHTFDWCAYIDIDEYIVLEKWENIKDFLNDFSDYQVIRLNWRIYGDDDLVFRDMTKPVYTLKQRVINHPYEFHGKEIVKGGFNANICSTHYSLIDGNLPKQIMPDGKETLGKVSDLHKCNEAYINHYMTKTLSEFVNQKLSRTDACFKDRKLDMSYYWDINRKTPKKINWLINNGYGV